MAYLATLLLPLLVLTTTTSATSLSHRSDPCFHLENITYTSQEIYSTPAHLAVAGGTISFNLTNSAVPYTAYCTAYGTQLTQFFFGNQVYECAAPTGPGVVNGSEGFGANFTFSTPDGAFNVNQTWGEEMRGKK